MASFFTKYLNKKNLVKKDLAKKYLSKKDLNKKYLNKKNLAKKYLSKKRAIISQVNYNKRHNKNIVHNQIYLTKAFISALLIFFITVFGLFGTTQITQNIIFGFQSHISDVKSVIDFFISVILSFIFFIFPIFIIIKSFIKKYIKNAINGLMAFSLALIIGIFIQSFLVVKFSDSEIIKSLFYNSTHNNISINILLLSFTALITSVSESENYFWVVLWFCVLLEVVMGYFSLSNAIITILFGTIIGNLVKYFSGTVLNIASIKEIIQALSDNGIKNIKEVEPAMKSNNSIYSRKYLVKTVKKKYVIYVVDKGNRLFTEMINVWRNFRIKGLNVKPNFSIDSILENATLLNYSVENIGINNNKFIFTKKIKESGIIVNEFLDIKPMDRDISYSQLINATKQLKIAHTAFLAHRQIIANAINFYDSKPFITNWHNGKINASEIEMNLDIVCYIFAISTIVGTQKAVNAVIEVFGVYKIIKLLPLIQKTILPIDTKKAINNSDLQNVREIILKFIPKSEKISNIKLYDVQRFDWKKGFVATLLFFALWIFFGTINFDTLSKALINASFPMLLIVFIFSMATYFFTSLSFIGFSVPKIPFWEVLLTHYEASFYAIAAPGSTSLFILQEKLLEKYKEKRSVAIATVVFIQVIFFLLSFLMLLFFCLFSGNLNAINKLPSNINILLILLLVIIIAIILMMIPKISKIIKKKIKEYINEIRPRFVWIMGQKNKLILGISSTLLHTISYIGAFYCTLVALVGGKNIDFAAVALVFLLANAAGGVFPSPGGIGGMEIALTAGLATIGINPSIGASVAIIYRLLTFWIPILFGYFAQKILNKYYSGIAIK